MTKKRIILSVALFFTVCISTFLFLQIRKDSSIEPVFADEKIVDIWQDLGIIFKPGEPPVKIPTVLPVPPTPAPTPTPTPVYNAKISITGDLMVHEWQLEDAKKKGDGTHTFDYCFENVKEYLSAADYTMGNLETTFAGPDVGYSGYPMFSAPDSFGEALKACGFDFLTTANNHSNDKREKGILRTIDVLDSLKLDHTGTYKSKEDRDTIFIKDINGIKFAFLSYTYGTNGLPLTEGKDYLANLLDENLIKSDIEKAKSLNPDFIVVLPHMGNEYELAPKQIFKDWINIMLKAGADIVFASHPHVLQPVEFIEIEDENGEKRDCFVAYSLGNFISSQRTEPRDAGLILNMEFEKTEGKKAFIKSVSYIPTWVKFTDASGKYYITVLSVNDAIKAIDSGEDINLKPSEIKRLRAVHNETVKMISGGENLPEAMQNEYYIFKANVTYTDLKNS